MVRSAVEVDGFVVEAAQSVAGVVRFATVAVELVAEVVGSVTGAVRLAAEVAAVRLADGVARSEVAQWFPPGIDLEG
jgi:hypothetical protein